MLRETIGFSLACAVKSLRESSCSQVESYPKVDPPQLRGSYGPTQWSIRWTILGTSLKINVDTQSSQLRSLI